MFSKFKFKDYINEGLASIGFKVPTEIQEEVIPKALDKVNIIGKSKTGTGKTHAFILPMLQMLDEELDEIQATIIVPTRELGTQIYEQILKITKFSLTPINCKLYVGGTDRQVELNKINKKSPQIVIGTIGKLNDLAIKENILKIHTSKLVIIDEADMVFEMSEISDLDKVFSRFNDIQVMSFSATIPNSLIDFLNKYFSNNVVIDLIGKNTQKEEIDHIFIPTKNKDKNSLLCSLLNFINPYLCLIFANTIKEVNEVSAMLSQNGFKVAKITGELESRERKQVLKRIKDGLYQYVVCSDIASRGLDIVGVSHVVNFSLPSDIMYYIHRIGRTARLNQTGQAISFYDYEDEEYLSNLKKKGLNYVYMSLKDGELVKTRERNYTQKKAKNEAIEEAIHKKYKMPDKVKPGYRKKRKEIINKEIKKAKKERINEMYRKRAIQKRYEDR